MVVRGSCLEGSGSGGWVGGAGDVAALFWISNSTSGMIIYSQFAGPSLHVCLFSLIFLFPKQCRCRDGTWSWIGSLHVSGSACRSAEVRVRRVPSSFSVVTFPLRRSKDKEQRTAEEGGRLV
jgi:hypothetical protein